MSEEGLAKIYMQIIDKYGYLESALDYIERHLASGRGLQNIAKKTGIDEDSLKNLSLLLNDFSEKKFFAVLQEIVDESHSFTPGADMEISGADVSIEMQKEKAFVLMNLLCGIVIDGEQEDKIKMGIKIFSNKDIRANC